MERSLNSRITGDNYRDYKRYLEIQKMNSGNNNNIFGNNNPSNNIINNGNRVNDNQNNPMNITTNSNNSRVPFVYIPMNRPPSSDQIKKNNINMEEENKIFLNNNKKLY